MIFYNVITINIMSRRIKCYFNMSSLPAAIIFVNSDLNKILKDTLISQLHITESITGAEFDSRIVAQPDYPTIIHASHLRILVIRDSFRDNTNRNLADIVMFVKQGLASIEFKNYGPPGLTLPVNKINIYDLLRYNNSSEVKIYPQPIPKQNACSCINSCNCGLGGIFAIEAQDTSGIYCPNTDNESHNKDFINRK